MDEEGKGWTLVNFPLTCSCYNIYLVKLLVGGAEKHIRTVGVQSAVEQADFALAFSLWVGCTLVDLVKQVSVLSRLFQTKHLLFHCIVQLSLGLNSPDPSESASGLLFPKKYLFKSLRIKIVFAKVLKGKVKL